MTVDRSTARGAAARGGARRPRGGNYSDPLYGEVRVAAWAVSLLQTRPFQRLAHVSLSDVPGELLFERPFPSRLEHIRGVYFLARLARPRDRMLQAAALAHDLGHGPFSHLTEPLMRERLGEDHEARAARLLERVRADLSDSALRQLGWLDWGEVAHLVVGGGSGRRGALLNGKLDYDNADNVARFLLAAELGQPGYDPRTLARALRLVGRTDLTEPPVTEDMPHTSNNRPGEGQAVYLLASAQGDALAWREDRAQVYNCLHEGHRNLALHAMLRKSIDLAAAADLVAPDFFDLTDMQALAELRSPRSTPGALIADQVARGDCYDCVWEALVPSARAPEIPFGCVRERLELERRLAAEAGLAGHNVVLEMLTSSAARSLPPLGMPNRPDSFASLPEPEVLPCVLHLFIVPQAGHDYVRRVRIAAERLFGRYDVQPKLPDGHA
jgi:hypothetical protein